MNSRESASNSLKFAAAGSSSSGEDSSGSESNPPSTAERICARSTWFRFPHTFLTSSATSSSGVEESSSTSKEGMVSAIFCKSAICSRPSASAAKTSSPSSSRSAYQSSTQIIRSTRARVSSSCEAALASKGTTTVGLGCAGMAGALASTPVAAASMVFPSRFNTHPP
ncbi:hypothetical protein STPH1_3408 [Streptomyces sp. OM5714]|nr:hypothetical protein STPH1_3408 [Streptomyces sp. OM5714]